MSVQIESLNYFAHFLSPAFWSDLDGFQGPRYIYLGGSPRIRTETETGWGETKPTITKPFIDGSNSAYRALPGLRFLANNPRTKNLRKPQKGTRYCFRTRYIARFRMCPVITLWLCALGYCPPSPGPSPCGLYIYRSASPLRGSHARRPYGFARAKSRNFLVAPHGRLRCTAEPLRSDAGKIA
jgi:hypothetical protein